MKNNIGKNDSVSFGGCAKRRELKAKNWVIQIISSGAILGMASMARAAITYTSIDHPDAGPLGTAVLDASGSDIYGTYYDASGIAHGFSMNAGIFTDINHPNAAGGTNVRTGGG